MQIELGQRMYLTRDGTVTPVEPIKGDSICIGVVVRDSDGIIVDVSDGITTRSVRLVKHKEWCVGTPYDD
jgi:hypothetical protein